MPRDDATHDESTSCWLKTKRDQQLYKFNAFTKRETDRNKAYP